MAPDIDEEKKLNYFILSNVDNKYRKLIHQYSLNLSSKDILKVISKYDSCIKNITIGNNLLRVIEIRLDRKTLFELNCTKYAQYIKESLNDYYDDILSRTTKKRSIIDEIIFKNRNL